MTDLLEPDRLAAAEAIRQHAEAMAQVVHAVVEPIAISYENENGFALERRLFNFPLDLSALVDPYGSISEMLEWGQQSLANAADGSEWEMLVWRVPPEWEFGKDFIEMREYNHLHFRGAFVGRKVAA